MKHLCISFSGVGSEENQILIARLSDQGFSGFEEKETGELLAYYPDDQLPENIGEEISGWGIAYSTELIEERNWNAEWESNFHPVTISARGGKPFVHIRADFHPQNPEAVHEIIITPKMSFGTGHHATTFLMVQCMKAIDFRNKSVIDFGTGTGVLAILAEKLGAKKITAIDVDDWSIENARENFARNHVENIELIKADHITGEQADIILANINLNVIKENLQRIFALCKPGGQILLSGMLLQDEEEISSLLNEHYVSLMIEYKENWLVVMVLSR